jgi:hypothetical protein
MEIELEFPTGGGGDKVQAFSDPQSGPDLQRIDITT